MALVQGPRPTDLPSTRWWEAMRVVFNYLIPYAVASIGYLAPFRVVERDAR